MPKLIIVVKEDTREILYGLSSVDTYPYERKKMMCVQKDKIDKTLLVNIEYAKFHQLEFVLECLTEEQVGNIQWEYRVPFGPYGVDPLVKVELPLEPPASQLKSSALSPRPGTSFLDEENPF